MTSSIALRAYVFAVTVAASLVLATLPTTNVPDRIGLLLVLVGLGVAAGVRPVRLPGLRIEMTPTHPVILVGLGVLGPMAAALIGLAGVLGAAVGRAHLPGPTRFVFNLGAVTLSSAGAAGAFFLAGGRSGQDLTSLILPLGAATVAYFFVNTGLLSAALALEERRRFVLTWRTSFSWSPASYVCGLALAVGLAAAIDNIAPWALVFGLPMCWLLTALYHNHAVALARTAGRG